MASYYPHYLGPCKSYVKIKKKKSIESSWNCLLLGWRQILPKINRLGVRGHESSKKAFFSEKVFDDNFRVWNDGAIILTPSCLPRQDASKQV